MTEITKDHVEWAVVDRLRQMLEEPPHRKFNVTQTYSLFIAILCWVMQRIRTPDDGNMTHEDRIARKLYGDLLAAAVEDDPWWVHVKPGKRSAKIGRKKSKCRRRQILTLIEPPGFWSILRDATAHGDTRNVVPFNVRVRGEWLLVGFTFTCAECLKAAALIGRGCGKERSPYSKAICGELAESSRSFTATRWAAVTDTLALMRSDPSARLQRDYAEPGNAR
jgi:hypothetical protein